MTYHDLPNVLFVGSLMIGVLAGYLPLIWVAFGLLGNGAILYFLQKVFTLMFGETSEQIYRTKSLACRVGYEVVRDLSKGSSFTREGTTVVAPSQWMGAASFFALFSVYNSFKIATRPAVTGAGKERVDTRRAFSASTLIIGLVFFGLILMRGYTGCETLFGGLSGVLISGGLAIGFWHLLDACGTGRIPDILQVVGAMAPESTKDTTPVVCTAPSREPSAPF